MVISEPCSLAKAALSGAKIVMARIELSSVVSLAVAASPANVVSSGLCAAAVTAGSILMPCKLPMPDAGIMPQSDPNTAASAIGWCGVMWSCDELAPVPDDPMLQAVAVSATTVVMMPLATALVTRIPLV